jgi:hypothetical protein
MIKIYDGLIRCLIMILPVIGYSIDNKIDEWYGILLNLFMVMISSMLIGYYGRNYDKLFKN